MLTARRIALISLLVAAAALLGGTPSAGAAASDVVPSGFVRVELPNVDGQTPWFSTGLNQSNLAAPAANDL